jgi:hypothetical protein
MTRRFPLLALGLLTLGALLFGRVAQAQYHNCGEGNGAKQEVTNAGQEFLLVYNQNEDRFYLTLTYQELYIASVRDSATVTITSRNYPNWKKVFNLLPRQAVTYRISQELDSCIMYGSEYISDLAFKVVSTSPIVVYGLNHKEFSADAFMTMPRNVVGMEYRIMSYHNSSITSIDQKPSQFGVIAFEDNTTVTIVPTYVTASGRPANVPFEIRLDSGQAYQVQAAWDYDGDLSGSIVRSDKPVAVFGAHVRAEVPFGFRVPDNSAITSRDHLVEQLPPISAWGKSFAMTKIEPGVLGDLIRVMALEDNTTVKMNGTNWSTINANRFDDVIIQGPTAFESDKPVLVAALAHTTHTYLGVGDPFMAIVPPVNQAYNDYTFFNSSDPAYVQQRLIVVTEQSGVGDIRLDGTVIPAASYTPLSTTMEGRNYSIAEVSVTAGRHDIIGNGIDQNGFTILAYGVGQADSYGYTAGGLFKPLRGIRAWNDTKSGPIDTRRRNEIVVQNIINDPVYLDSATVVTKDGRRDVIKLKERVWQDINEVPYRGSESFHLEAMQELDEPVAGTLTIHNACYRWGRLEPLSVDFVYYPEAAAAVKDIENVLGLQVWPRVAARKLNVSSTEVMHGVSLSVIDALGRVVIEQNDLTITGQTAVFDVSSLAAGHYTVMIKSAEGLQKAKIIKQ